MKPDCFLLCLVSCLLVFTSAAQSTNKTSDTRVPPPPPAPPAPPSFPRSSPEGRPLFDGKTMRGWEETKFGGPGSVSVENGELRIDMGNELTGVTWTNAQVLPKTNYEISLEAMKRDGTDFFCGLTFPVGTNFCTLIVGGWGGGVVGLSSLDGMDASENDTTKYRSFDKNTWYTIRLQVTPERIVTWIDDEKLIDAEIEDRKVSLRFGDIDLSTPLGIATYQTSASYRNIRLKKVQ